MKVKIGEMMLRDFKAFIFDLDGCIYRGNTPIPGAADTIASLRKNGKKILFLTNNATQTPEQYVEKLKGMKIDADVNVILTSAMATAIFLKKKYGKVRVFPVGGQALIQELEKIGHKIVDAHEIKRTEFVVACLDLAFTYEKLDLACQAIFSGAKLVATNTDPNVPVEKGFELGAGAIVAAISTATGAKPEVIGKPFEHITKIALDRLGTTPSETVFVGDRLDTDIQAGKEIGGFTILVLSGSTNRDTAEKVTDPNQKPNLILPDISYIQQLLI